MHFPALLSAALFPFPPPSSQLPILYFGANATGPENAAQLAFDVHTGTELAGWGWQQNSTASDFRHGEASLASAAAALAAAHAGSSPRRFVYRHMQMAWTLFDVTRAADAGTNRSLFLRNHDNAADAAECRQTVPGNGTSPLLAWGPGTVPGLAESFWVNNVTAEVAREPFVDAVFFDETDWSACGYDFAKVGCANISDSFRVADLRAKLPSLRGTADALAAAGKLAIFSAKNLLESAWEGLPANASRPCVISHDEYARALDGAAYIRFEEFWMGQGRDTDAATIANALLLGARGVGLIARGSADSAGACASSSTCASAAYHTAGLAYSLAAFLVARTSPYSYFGYSSGWYSDCWCWHSEFDSAASCGAPTAPAQRTSAFTWTRAYERCDVEVDTSRSHGAWTTRQLSAVAS